MTYAEFVDSIKSIVFPDREASRLKAGHSKYVLDGLIQLQRAVPCLRSRNFNTIAFSDTFFRCMMTVVPKPDGIIKRVWTYSTTDMCDDVLYTPTSRIHLERLVKEACGTGVSPRGGIQIGAVFVPYDPLPQGLLHADAITDKRFRAGRGWFCIVEDEIWLYPYIESVEKVVVEWQGIKKEFSDADIVTYERDVQSALELYVRRETALRENCDTNEYLKFKSSFSEAQTDLIWWCRQTTERPEPEYWPPGCSLCTFATAQPGEAPETFMSFVAFGDSGEPNGPPGNPLSDTQQVSNLVKRLEPEFIVHLGDCSYPDATTENLQTNLLDFYDYKIPEDWWHAFGEHDQTLDAGAAVLQLLPNVMAAGGGKLYYRFSQGPVDFFVCNTGATGVKELSSGTPQMSWLEDQLTQSLANSPDRWRIVVMHKPESTSSVIHYRNTDLPDGFDFHLWGADLVVSGHGHHYERFFLGGVHRLICGAGGATLAGFIDPPEQNSIKRYNAEYGVLKFVVSSKRCTVSFVTVSNKIIDTIELRRGEAPPPEGTPPAIIEHPVSITRAIGQGASFRVTMSGSQPLFVQWQKDGIDIPGKNFSVLNLNVNSFGDAGAYRAIVTNAYGSVVSNPATLTVILAQAYTIYLGNAGTGTPVFYTEAQILAMDNGAFGITTERTQIDGAYQIAAPASGQNEYRLICVPRDLTTAPLRFQSAGFNLPMDVVQEALDINGALYRVFRTTVPSAGDFTTAGGTQILISL